MELSEFQKLLGADPWSREPETLRARNSAPEFERAAAAAEEFERKLEAAVEVPLDDELLNGILAIPGQASAKTFPRWLAMAAGVVLVAGLSGVIWFQSRGPESVPDYVFQHHAYDGQELLDLASGDFDPALVGKVLARFGVAAGSDLAQRVLFIKFCPTPDGRGAHMIVSSEQGPLHVIFMPRTQVDDGREFRLGGMRTVLVGLASGSAAIIGRTDQALDGVGTLLRASLFPATADA